jgi:hypothetical protein
VSKTRKKNDKYGPKQDHRLRVRAVKRNPTDVHRLGRALLALAMADNEAEARRARPSRNERPTEGDR